MRLIDADALNKIKFHPLPYTHITPSDVDAESYERGWNDAVDAIMSEAETVEPEQKTGKWLPDNRPGGGFWVCSCCKFPSEAFAADVLYKFCPNCGAYMGGDTDETD